MKTLFQLNKVLIIIWAVLMLTIYLGLLFMMPLGFIQILCSIYLISGRRWANKAIRDMTFTHLSVSILILMSMFLIDNYSEWMIVVFVISGFLALFFTYITYKNYKAFEGVNNKTYV